MAVGPAEGMCVYFAGALGPAGISSLYLYHLALTKAFPGTPRLSQPGTLWDKELREFRGGVYLQVEYPFSKMLECFRCLNFFPPRPGTICIYMMRPNSQQEIHSCFIYTEPAGNFTHRVSVLCMHRSFMVWNFPPVASGWMLTKFQDFRAFGVL